MKFAEITTSKKKEEFGMPKFFLKVFITPSLLHTGNQFRKCKRLSCNYLSTSRKYRKTFMGIAAKRS